MKLKVLIIEDESIVALHIKKTVMLSGNDVIEVVKNGNEALEIAKNTRVDLVISDINIDGDLDGVECCKILQNKYKLPIIFITAYRDMNTLKKASDVDFVGYLVKPFREDELETMIHLATLKYGLLTQKDRYIICEKYSYCYNINDLLLDNIPIKLTKKENRFLLSLIGAKGSVVSHNTLEHDIWYGEQVDENTRRQLVHRFKQKAPNFPLILVKGIGYKLEI